MSKWRGLAAALASVAIVQPAVAADRNSPSPPTSAPVHDQISMESYSWGRLLWSWTVNADGSGQLTSTGPMSKDLNERVATTKHWSASAGRFKEVSELLSSAESYADKTLPCTKAIYDLPYGSVAWSHGGKKRVVNFDLGCRSIEVDKIYAQMAAAYGLASKWAAGAEADEGSKGQ